MRRHYISAFCCSFNPAHHAATICHPRSYLSDVRSRQTERHRCGAVLQRNVPKDKARRGSGVGRAVPHLLCHEEAGDHVSEWGYQFGDV